MRAYVNGMLYAQLKPGRCGQWREHASPARLKFDPVKLTNGFVLRLRFPELRFAQFRIAGVITK